MGTAWVAGCGFLQRGRTRLLAMEGFQERKGVVCVGLVCLDLVTVVDQFPKEDTDMRSSAQYKVRGGNANNSCRVLAELGFPATFLGSLAGQGDADTDFVLRGMEEDCVEVSPACPRHEGHICPNSVVLASSATGSRTIVHTNLGLPELSLQDLHKVQVEDYSWIHLEGRNRENLLLMLEYLAKQDSVKVSVEVEKVGRNFEDFIPLADVVFVSNDVAQWHGCADMESAISEFRPKLRQGASLVVAWGEAGAAAWNLEEGLIISPAFPPPGGVLDTLGAGDTFNAAVIGCLAAKLGLASSVRPACQVAGMKVGMRGFKGLGQQAKPILALALAPSTPCL